MAKEDTLETTAVSAPAVEPPKESVNLEARIAELETKSQQDSQKQEERLKEAQRVIQDLSNERAVLEQRLQSISDRPSPNATQSDNLEQALDEAMKDVAVDPGLTAKRLAAIIRARDENLQKSRVAETEKLRQETERQTHQALHIEEVKRQNPDIIGTAFEFKARQVAEELMRTKRMPFEEAVDAGIKVAKKEKEEMIAKELAKNKQASPPPPPGSQGELGSNAPPSPPKKETKEPETMEESIAQGTQEALEERQALDRKRARGK